jgi:hypothetical protein
LSVISFLSQQTDRQECLSYMLKPILILVGIVLAAVGGVIAYRALFLEPSAAVVITSSGDVRELPNYARIIGGSVLFIVGTAIALTAARRKR